MTIESDIYDTLKGLVGNRVFPDVAPFSTTRPYITYQQVGGTPIHYIDPTLADKKHGLFQINVWAETRSQAASLALQVEAAFIAATAYQARPAGGLVAQHEPDLNLYGTMQDFDVWSTR